MIPALAVCSILAYFIIGYIVALVWKHNKIIEYKKHGGDSPWGDFTFIMLMWGTIAAFWIAVGVAAIPLVPLYLLFSWMGPAIKQGTESLARKI